MADARAQKKLPASLCPRGAEDTDLSGSDWTLLSRKRSREQAPGPRRARSV